MSDGITREELNHSFERIHLRVDDIAKTSTEISVCAKSIKDDVKDMRTVLYGNGRDGVIQKITALCSKVNVQWWLIGLIIAGLFGIIWKVITK